MRSIATEGLNYLANNTSITIYHLIRIETATSTSGSPAYYYLTDAPMTITFDSNQYAANKVTKVGALTMAEGLQTHKLAIDIAGEYQEELDRGLIGPSSSTSYLNKEIVVNRIYLDSNGASVNMSDDNNGAMFYFRGLITNINVNESIKTGVSTVTWSCSNHFEDFNTINGRLTDDTVHRGLIVNGSGALEASQAAKTTAHQTDKGFIHANQAIDLIAKFTTKETRYKTKSSWGGFKTKVKSYEVDVVNDLDLRFDLAAKFLPTIYGIRKVSGIPVFIDVDKSNPDDVYVVYAVCEGEIDGFLDVYIDGIPAICSSGDFASDTLCIGNQKSGNTLGIASNSGVGNNDPVGTGRTLNISTDQTTASMIFYNGTSTQAADLTMVNMAASNRFMLQGSSGSSYWDSTYQLLDTAYVVMKYTINEDSTNIPEIEFVVQGKQVEVYQGASSSTTNYTLNPVWHLLDYMTSSMYGGDLPVSEFDIDSFMVVASELDTTDTNYEMGWLNYYRYIGWEDTSSERRQKVQCNTLLPGSTSVIDNIKSVLEQFDGTLNLVDGNYHLSMKRVSTNVADIDVSDIIGKISTKDQSNKDTWNTIQANIQDPAIGWTSNKITFFNNDYKSEDRSIEKKGNVSYKHITNYYTARSRAETALNQSRYSREFTFTVWHRFSYLTPNDVITLTYSRFKFNNKSLMVSKVVTNSNGTITITAKDYDASIYSSTVQSDNGDNEGTVMLGVPRVKDLQVDNYFGSEEGVYGVLNWIDATSNTGGLSHYEVREGANEWVVQRGTVDVIQIDDTPTFRDNPISGALSEPRPYLELTNLRPLDSYIFEVRSVLMDGTASSWETKIYVASEIDTNLPSITGFRVVNLEPGYEDQFYGGSVFLEWDGSIDASVSGYTIDVVLGNQDGAEDIARTVLGSSIDITLTLTEEEKVTHEYTLTDNMEAYATDNAGAIGVYRDLGFRIKAVNSSGGKSSSWTYIE